MQNKFESLKDEDVVAIKESFSSEITQHPTFKVEDVAFENQVKLLKIPTGYWEREEFQERKTWVNEGYDCELLSPGDKKWKKGKVRIKVTLEFCPDDPVDMQPESPLDDIRNSLK